MALDLVVCSERLAAAMIAGGALGLNRDLHHKAAGVRTHATVAVGSALAVHIVQILAPGQPLALSPVIQGLVTGIGFLGAGVILRGDAHQRVHGLTTAASTWVACILGVAAGVGELRILALGVVALLLVLILGGPLERAVERRFGHDDDDVPPDAPTRVDTHNSAMKDLRR